MLFPDMFHFVQTSAALGKGCGAIWQCCPQDRDDHPAEELGILEQNWHQNWHSNHSAVLTGISQLAQPGDLLIRCSHPQVVAQAS